MNLADASVQFDGVAVRNGGTYIKDPLGIRSGSLGSLFLAYMRDTDGNELCAPHAVS